MEQKYATVEKGGKTYVKKIQDVKDDEHISGIFLSKISACNVARRNAKYLNLEYVPVGRQQDERNVI